MRFVLANRQMAFVGGTEIHLVTVAEHLRRLGHDAVIYTPELGAYSDHARSRGLEVLGTLRELPLECDVVFAQDAIVAYDMAERYPSALFVYRVCGDFNEFQLLPQAEDVIDLVIVLSDRYARLVEASAVKAPMVRLRVPIDVDRLAPIGRIRERPRRAVVIGNYTDRFELVRDAWESHGIEVAQVGLANGAGQSFDVAAALADADIVVAKSRTALDAMACGRAVYVLDVFGGDGWVTPEIYPALEADHFAGHASDRVIDKLGLERDLADYSREMGSANRDLVMQHHNARYHVMELVAAIDAHKARDGAQRPQRRPPMPLRELSRMTALHCSWEALARSHQVSAGILIERVQHVEEAMAEESQALANAESERLQALARVAELEQRSADDAARVLAAEAEIEQMRATRARRLACQYWRIARRSRGSAAPMP